MHCMWLQPSMRSTMWPQPRAGQRFHILLRAMWCTAASSAERCSGGSAWKSLQVRPWGQVTQ